jgi:Zn-dependent protease with chaperone function
MSNLIHHFLAAAWSFALVAGVLTLASKLWLRRRLDGLTHPAQFDSPMVYIALVVPGLLPVVWLVSGLMHLDESGALMQACCSVLALSEASWQQWIFGAGALAVAGIQAFSLWKKWRPTHRAHRATSLDQAARRVRRVCQAHDQLSAFSQRVRVVDCGAYICATVGLVDQRIEIAASLVERLDDDALEAALLHETAHFRSRDPALGFFLLLAQVINPFSRALCKEASAWRFAREIICDGHAVEHGARPVSVADAIVTAAKAAANTPRGACAHLCGTQIDALSVRVNLLLSGPKPCATNTAHECNNSAKVPAIGSAILAFGLIVPHLLGARVISFHCLLEETLGTLTFLF